MENNLGFEKVFAVADIKGSRDYPDINGRVIFKKKGNGVLVTVEVLGLPHEDGKCKERVFGFHIHEGTSCTGNNNDLFADAKGHYNPDNCIHPMHAGDMPPLFENNGYTHIFLFTQIDLQ